MAERMPSVRTGNEAVDRALAHIKRVLDWLVTRHDLETQRREASTLAGTTTAIALSATGTVNVEHGLGRRFRGWRVIDLDAAVTIYRDPAAGPDLTKHLPLQATGPVNAIIEVW